MRREELAASMAEACIMEGDFVLRSGRRATEYFDKYAFAGRPDLLAKVTEELARLVPAGTNMLAGVELGGVVLATALSLRLRLPVVFVRKEAKEYGTARLIEGPTVRGASVCVVEDVITTGGQVAKCATALREAGATVTSVVSVVDRSGGSNVLAGAGLEHRPAFTGDELSRHRGAAAKDG